MRIDPPGKTVKTVDLKLLHAKIRQQALELDFLNSALIKVGLQSTSN